MQLNDLIEELQAKDNLSEHDKLRLDTAQKYRKNFSRIQKIDIQSTFGFYKKLANGEKGRILLMPDLELMHCSH